MVKLYVILLYILYATSVQSHGTMPYDCVIMMETYWVLSYIDMCIPFPGYYSKSCFNWSDNVTFSCQGGFDYFFFGKNCIRSSPSDQLSEPPC